MARQSRSRTLSPPAAPTTDSPPQPPPTPGRQRGAAAQQSSGDEDEALSTQALSTTIDGTAARQTPSALAQLTQDGGTNPSATRNETDTNAKHGQASAQAQSLRTAINDTSPTRSGKRKRGILTNPDDVMPEAPPKKRLTRSSAKEVEAQAEAEAAAQAAAPDFPARPKKNFSRGVRFSDTDEVREFDKEEAPTPEKFVADDAVEEAVGGDDGASWKNEARTEELAEWIEAEGREVADGFEEEVALNTEGGIAGEYQDQGGKAGEVEEGKKPAEE